MSAKESTRKDVEAQVAALPVRIGPDGVPEVLLITSRETRRWVIPKGNLMKGLKKSKAAYLEAKEEAGVKGSIEPKSYRSFDYWKRRAEGFSLCQVEVFLLFATQLQDRWKEKAQRRRVWVPAEVAAGLVLEPGLQSILIELATDRDVLDRLRATVPAAKNKADQNRAGAGERPRRARAAEEKSR